MHILFIVPYSPTRIRVRPYNLIKHLAGRNNSVTLATVWEDEAELTALKEFERLGVRVISQPLQKTRVLTNTGRTFFSSTPLQARYSWQPALAEQLSELLTSDPNRWDIIHVEHLCGAQIWAEELNLEQVGVDNIFSNLGGDSLLTAVLFSKVIETYKDRVFVDRVL